MDHPRRLDRSLNGLITLLSNRPKRTRKGKCPNGHVPAAPESKASEEVRLRERGSETVKTTRMIQRKTIARVIVGFFKTLVVLNL